MKEKIKTWAWNYAVPSVTLIGYSACLYWGWDNEALRGVSLFCIGFSVNDIIANYFLARSRKRLDEVYGLNDKLLKTCDQWEDRFEKQKILIEFLKKDREGLVDELKVAETYNTH